MILNKTIKFCEFHHFANLTTLLAFSKSVKKLNKCRKRHHSIKIDGNLNWKNHIHEIELKRANNLLLTV